jgi:hypothetical protein
MPVDGMVVLFQPKLSKVKLSKPVLPTVREAPGTSSELRDTVIDAPASPANPASTVAARIERWTPSFGQENAEIKLGSQALLD